MKRRFHHATTWLLAAAARTSADAIHVKFTDAAGNGVREGPAAVAKVDAGSTANWHTSARRPLLPRFRRLTVRAGRSRDNGGVIDIGAYWRDGYAIVPGLVSTRDATALVAAAADLATRSAAGDAIEPTFVTAESNLIDGARGGAADAVSKVFRVHQRSPFAELAHRDDVVDLAAAVLGTDDVDCFLSQFIFKNPGAWGQPCHQDSYYFPFRPARPVVGVWVAATDAKRDNGCLYVVPGSHTEPVHTHVPDRRPDANLGYFEIVDHDLSNAVGVEMEPGDVLVFDSHLMHFSTDNASTRRRAAMVYHYARAGTTDHTVEHRGFSINDWVAVRRGGSWSA